MNKGKIILFVFIFLILVGIAEQIVFRTILNNSRIEAEEIKEIVEPTFVQEDNILTLLNEFEERWEKRQNIICTFSNYKEVEDVGPCITKLKDATQNHNYVIAIENIDLILYFLEEYKNLVGTSIQNIF